MSVSSSVGLISGIDHSKIIDQLMQLESRSQTLVKNQTAVLQSKQVAFQAINAKLLALKLSADNITKSTAFTKNNVTSSNESVVTATAAATASPGSYTFSVAQLVTTQQAISQGVSNKDTATFGASTLTFEFGNARLDGKTELSGLNGGDGIIRGKIRVTDRSGSSAVVDLSKAVTVDDVLEAINNTSGINVSASVEGDSISLTDHTGQTASSLVVADVNTQGVAASLGLLGSAAADTYTGQSINTLGDATQLTSLNDGNGVRSARSQDDFAVTSSGGVSFNVDISSAKTIGDVIDLINNNTNNTGQVITASRDGAHLKITDGAGGGAGFSITALNGSAAATDLGILNSDSDNSGSIEGSRLLAGLNSKLLKNLRGGDGSLNLGIIDINGSQVDLSGAQSVSDILNTINQANLGVSASLNSAGNGLALTGAPNTTVAVTDVSGNAASFLGLDNTSSNGVVDSGNLQFRYLSESTQLATLNGGKGVAKGNFIITDSDGLSATVDMSDGDEHTIQDVISEINSRGLAIHAQINENGDGIALQDTGSGSVAIKIDESGSTTARDLGLVGEAANAGDDLVGTFEKHIEIADTDTLTDITKKINDAGLGVRASIFSDGSSANPYRLSLISQKAGQAGAFVFDDGGLGLGMNNLVQAQDAVVFYGSSDPAKGVAIVSPTNTLTSLIPGVTINLHSVNANPVTVNISQDDSAVGDTIKKFVDDFNAVMDSVKKYDSYDADTKTKGLLLGDSTLSSVSSSLYRILSTRNGEVPGIFKSMSQVGLSLNGNGARLSFDSSKFAQALATDRDAVIGLFTFKQTTTDPDTNVTTTTKAGFGVKMSDLLANLTDATNGKLQSTMDNLTTRIDQNNKRVDDMQSLLDAKRSRLEFSFNRMETVLAQLQGQTNALSSLQQLATSWNGNNK